MKRKKRANKKGRLSLILGILALLSSLTPLLSIEIENLLFKYARLWHFYFLKYKLNDFSWNGFWLGPLLGVSAILFSMLQKKKTHSSRWSLILGIAAIILPVLYTLTVFAVFLYYLITAPTW